MDRETFSDIPFGTILPVRSIRVRLDKSPHPYQVENAVEIDAYWKNESAQNPALFNGEVIMLASLRYEVGRIVGVCHPIRFSTFLHWRSNAFAGAGYHIFANAMPVASDGALIAVRMAEHTANAGRVYFAAGSFEREDFKNGYVDVPANMHREVCEETGIDLKPLSRDETYHLVRTDSGLTLVRRYYLSRDSESVVQAVKNHIATGKDDEIDDVVAIHNLDDIPDSAPAHMAPLVEWHLNTSTPGLESDKRRA